VRNVLTYEEELLLANLLDGPQEDRDCTPHRVLVNTGLARRVDIGQIEITAAGIDKLGALAKARDDSDDVHNGDHGF
jgi:hypothetical protein